MNVYKLTAHRNNVRNTIGFTADDDSDAMATAAFRVLEAASKSQLWAKGEITLRDHAGRVVATMPAKTGASS